LRALHITRPNTGDVRAWTSYWRTEPGCVVVMRIWIGKVEEDARAPAVAPRAG
jgi:hypothetical protein